MTGGELILLLGVLYLMSKQLDIEWGEVRPVWNPLWVWPVPHDAAAGDPVVSQEFRRPDHMGVDVMFRVAGRFTAPHGTPVLAARDGTVWSTGKTARGWNVVLDHGAPWATFYQHLEVEPLVAKGQAVKAGQPIGVMGVDPTDGAQVRHLHFAAWYRGHGDAASVDPAAQMARWPVLTV